MIEFWKGETCRIWATGTEIRFSVLADRRPNVAHIVEGKLVPQPEGRFRIVPTLLRALSRETGKWLVIPSRDLNEIGQRALWALRSRHPIEGWIIARSRECLDDDNRSDLLPIPASHWFLAMLPTASTTVEAKRSDWRCLGDVLHYSLERGSETLAGLARIAGTSRRLLHRALEQVGSPDNHRGYLLDPRWPVGLGRAPLLKLADWATSLGDPALSDAYRQLAHLSQSISETRGGRRTPPKTPKPKIDLPPRD